MPTLGEIERDVRRLARRANRVLSKATGKVSRRPFDKGWIAEYLPHYLTNSFCPLHDDLIAAMGSLETVRGQRLNFMAPRGFAKSTNVSKASPLHGAVEGVEPFTLLLSDTQGQAESFLKAIKTELVGNERLRRSYPRACGVGPVWKSDEIVLNNGCMIVARGAMGTIRGLTNQSRRPTRVVIDDANKKQDIHSPTLRSRVLEWVSKDVMPVGEPGYTNFVCVGTPIHRESVVCDLARNPTWRTRRYRSIGKYPDRMDLWMRWEQILSDLGNPERVSAAAEFYAANSVDMDGGAELLWGERFPLDFLMRERATIGGDAFDSEYQDTPGMAGMTEWPPSYFDDIWFHDWPDDLMGKALFLDPSKGRTDKPSDWQAHVWGAWSKSQRCLYVEADLRREPGVDMVQRAINHAKGFGASAVTVEGNSDGVGLLYPIFQELLAKTGNALGYDSIHVTDNKISRIRGLGPYLARGQLKVRNTPGGKMLVDQLRDVPSGEYDDGPDSLSGAVRVIQKLLR